MNSTRPSDDEFLTRQQVADKLGISPRTLLNFEYDRSGPPTIRIGRQLRYPKSQLDLWLSQQQVA